MREVRPRICKFAREGQKQNLWLGKSSSGRKEQNQIQNIEKATNSFHSVIKSKEETI
jgi:hypothetical protein